MELMPGLFKDKALLNSLFQAFTDSDDGRYLFVIDEQTGEMRWCSSAVEFLDFQENLSLVVSRTGY